MAIASKTVNTADSVVVDTSFVSAPEDEYINVVDDEPSPKVERISND
uniref:Uncharacterized protein n=1 Tax=Caenorhabditis japonica TaxID=281687 RepID=A0A8R1J2E9_CAEJA